MSKWVGRVVCLPEVSGGGVHSLTSLASRAFYPAFCMAPPPSSNFCFCTNLFLRLWPSCLSLLRTSWWHWTILVIQDLSHPNILHLILLAKSLCPVRWRYVQVLGVGTWTSLEGMILSQPPSHFKFAWEEISTKNMKWPFLYFMPPMGVLMQLRLRASHSPTSSPWHFAVLKLCSGDMKVFATSNKPLARELVLRAHQASRVEGCFSQTVAATNGRSYPRPSLFYQTHSGKWVYARAQPCPGVLHLCTQRLDLSNMEANVKSGLLELCLKGAHEDSLYEENNAYLSAWILSALAIYSIFFALLPIFCYIPD